MAEENQSPEMSEEELKQLASLVGTANIAEDRSNVHAFLTKIIQHKDNTKIANLNDEELGAAKLPVRTLQELGLFCNDIGNMPYFSDYFKKEAQITLATSLSRDAKIIEAAITTSRTVGEIQKKTKPKPNKGWFKRGRR